MATRRAFSLAICLATVLWANSGLCYQSDYEETYKPGYTDSNNPGYGEYASSNNPGYGGYDNSTNAGYRGNANNPGYGGYDNNPGNGGYDNNPGYGGYDNNQGNGGYDNNPEYGGYDNNPGNGGYDNNPGYGGYDSKSGYGGYDNTPGNGGYDNNPGYGGYDSKSGYGGYDNNPGNGGYDKNPRYGGYDNNPGYGGYDNTPGYGDYDNNPGYGGYDNNPWYGGYDDFYKRRSYDGSYQPGNDYRPKNVFYFYGSSYQPYQNRYDQNPSYNIHRPTPSPSPGSLDYCRLAGGGGNTVATFGPSNFWFIYKGTAIGMQAQVASTKREKFVSAYSQDVRTLASLGFLRSSSKADFKGRTNDERIATKVYDSGRSRTYCFIGTYEECNITFHSSAAGTYDWVRRGKVNVDFKDVLKYRVNGRVSRAALKWDNPTLGNFCEEAGNNLYTLEQGEASGPHITLSIFNVQGPVDIEIGKNYV